MNFLATIIQCTLAAIVISAVIGLVRNSLHAQLLIVQHQWVVRSDIFIEYRKRGRGGITSFMQ